MFKNIRLTEPGVHKYKANLGNGAGIHPNSLAIPSPGFKLAVLKVWCMRPYGGQYLSPADQH